MKVINISKTRIGTQAVLEARSDKGEPRQITKGDREWVRHRAASVPLKREHDIQGELVSVDIKYYVGGLMQLQYSFKE